MKRQSLIYWFVPLAVVLAGAVILSNSGSSNPAPAVQVSGPPTTALHLSTAVHRTQREDSKDALQRSIILNGMEPGKAGFHLLRSPKDPQWTAGFGRLHPTIDFRWFGVPTKYNNIEYQRMVPVELDPAPAYTWSALVSQSRLFANSLGSASWVASGASHKVQFTFTQRGISALQAMLAPTSAIVNGHQDDWYHVSRLVGEAPTPMVCVVVAQHLVYLPIDVSALLVAASQGNRTVDVAIDLTQAEAVELANRLNAS